MSPSIDPRIKPRTWRADDSRATSAEYSVLLGLILAAVYLALAMNLFGDEGQRLWSPNAEVIQQVASIIGEDV